MPWKRVASLKRRCKIGLNLCSALDEKRVGRLEEIGYDGVNFFFQPWMRIL